MLRPFGDGEFWVLPTMHLPWEPSHFSWPPSAAVILSGTAADLLIKGLRGREHTVVLHEVLEVAQTLRHFLWSMPAFFLEGIFESKAFA